MAYYTICGKPECINYAHAAYVAQYLYEHLPNFKYKKIEKSRSDWPGFVANLNRKYKWFQIKSPIIWKEISDWGGKPYLIGGLGEFWEYCYCYYGLESVIPKADLQNLAKDNIKFFQEDEDKHSKKSETYDIVVSIFGAGLISDMTEHLLEELLTISAFSKENGFFVKLYDLYLLNEEFVKQKKYIQGVVDGYNEQSIFGNRKVASIVYTEQEAVEKADLLIFLEDFSRYENENFDFWRKRCVTRIAILSDTINTHGKRPLRVIFSNEGPACLMATCMIEFCTALIPSNIVVLTADKGLSVINAVSEVTGLHVSKMAAPPVWGFVGISEFVDDANILFKANVFRPYKRALTAPKDSTLPLGIVVPELRLMSYLVSEQRDKISKMVEEKKIAIETKLHRKPFLPKLRALVSLMNIWYSEELSDRIISLGVCSNGSYKIPAGIVFSQPSLLDKRGRWRPVSNFPLMNEATWCELKKLTDDASSILEQILNVKEPMDYTSSTSYVLPIGRSITSRSESYL